MWRSPEFPRTQETAARSFPAALLPKILSIADQTPRDALLQRFQYTISYSTKAGMKTGPLRVATGSAATVEREFAHLATVHDFSDDGAVGLHLDTRGLDDHGF